MMAEREIRFHSTKGDCGWMSDFAYYPIRYAGKTWPITEHYLQAQKFAGTQKLFVSQDPRGQEAASTKIRSISDAVTPVVSPPSPSW